MHDVREDLLGQMTLPEKVALLAGTIQAILTCGGLL
jgi:hypothetical protein